MMTDFQEIEKIADHIRRCESLVILTGAGVSKESGVPTFRDKSQAPGAALWADYDPMQLATPEGFLKDPSLVWRWYDWRRALVRDVEPNAGHVAMAGLQKYMVDRGKKFLLVTQNVDQLHQRAGATGVLELHGNITSFRCFERGHQFTGDVPFGEEFPPLCHCGALLRPNVVWFGEALPAAVLSEATAAAKKCEVMLVVGTSALVHPAASLPYIALDAKAFVAEINPDETPLTHHATTFVRGASGSVMPQLVRFLEGAN